MCILWPWSRERLPSAPLPSPLCLHPAQVVQHSRWVHTIPVTDIKPFSAWNSTFFSLWVSGLFPYIFLTALFFSSVTFKLLFLLSAVTMRIRWTCPCRTEYRGPTYAPGHKQWCGGPNCRTQLSCRRKWKKNQTRLGLEGPKRSSELSQGAF